METINRKYIFSGCDVEDTYIDIISNGKLGAVVLTEDRKIIPFALANVDDVDQLISALNVLRNDMLNEVK